MGQLSELDIGTRSPRVRPTTLLLIADPSPEAGRAVGACIELARALEADVIVLHVHERNAWLVGTGDFRTVDEAKQFVTRVADRVRRAEIRARAEVLTTRTGRRAAALSDAASRGDIDLVVVGVPRPSGLRRVLGTAFVDGLVKRSSRPVLAIA